MKRIFLLILLAALAACRPASPVDALLERIDPGASRRISKSTAAAGNPSSAGTARSM